MTTSYLHLGQPATIEQLQALNTVTGHKFFSRDTLRSFKSRVYQEVWTRPEGWVFITSEKNGYADPREYTARIMNEDGAVSEFAGSSFGQFKTKRQAKQFVESIIKLAKEETENDPSTN